MAVIEPAFGVVSGTLGSNTMHTTKFLIDQRILGGLVTGSAGHLGRAPVNGAFSHLPVLERAQTSAAERQTYLSASFEGASGSIIQALNACMQVGQDAQTAAALAASSADVTEAEVRSALGSATGLVGIAKSVGVSGSLYVSGNMKINSIDSAGAVTVATTLGVTQAATFTAASVHNASLSVKNGASSAGFVEFFEDSNNGSNKITLIGPATTADATVTLPSVAGHVAVLADTPTAASAAVTAAEFALLDGATSATSTTVAAADRVILNDAGTMAQVAVSDLDTFFSQTSKTLTNKTLTSPTINAATLAGVGTKFTGPGVRFGVSGSSNLYIAGHDENGISCHYRVAVSGGMLQLEQDPQ